MKMELYAIAARKENETGHEKPIALEHKNVHKEWSFWN